MTLQGCVHRRVVHTEGGENEGGDAEGVRDEVRRPTKVDVGWENARARRVV